MSDDRQILERRVAVLEQIARDTAAALADIRSGLRDLHSEMQAMRTDLRGEIQELRTRQHADFLWLLGIMLGSVAGLFAIMAHGFHWM